jgi:hypothetical protein
MGNAVVLAGAGQPGHVQLAHDQLKVLSSG